MRIGIVGAGRIGSTVGTLWVRAGHEVRFASRHPESLDFVRALGARASTGTPEDAAAFGEALLVAVPYGALPALGRALAVPLRGKVVLETGNPYPERDGELADKVLESGVGTGRWSQSFLEGARLVRAFNTVRNETLAREAHRHGDRVAIPLAGNDREALRVAERLVEDAGFEPVFVGDLDRARDFDVGTPAYDRALAAAELWAVLDGASRGIAPGFQVFTEDGGEEFGAVREVRPAGKPELVVFVENAGEFRVPLAAVRAVHAGKVILDVRHLPTQLQSAIGHAHDAERF
jgi:8-hydroxy-5-deazaflavin:NADPH oxidoreductase